MSWMRLMKDSVLVKYFSSNKPKAIGALVGLGLSTFIRHQQLQIYLRIAKLNAMKFWVTYKGSGLNITVGICKPASKWLP